MFDSFDNYELGIKQKVEQRLLNPNAGSISKKKKQFQTIHHFEQLYFKVKNVIKKTLKPNLHKKIDKIWLKLRVIEIL